MKTESTSTPEDLVQAFATCENFPKEREGVLALAQALKRASADFRVSMDRIVQDCCDSSRWCPTPRDIRNVALALRDNDRQKRKGNQERSWEQIYGPAQPEWSAALLGLLDSSTHEERVRAIHIRAIRDTLYYTEGEGAESGGRTFWEQSSRTNRANYPELVAQVRAAGGWQTERELQMDWIDVAWQLPEKKERK